MGVHLSERGENLRLVVKHGCVRMCSVCCGIETVPAGLKYRQIVLLVSSRLALERMYYKRVGPHRVIAQQCELKSVRQPNQWGVKESNYKAAKKQRQIRWNSCS